MVDVNDVIVYAFVAGLAGLALFAFFVSKQLKEYSQQLRVIQQKTATAVTAALQAAELRSRVAEKTMSSISADTMERRITAFVDELKGSRSKAQSAGTKVRVAKKASRKKKVE